MPAPHLRSTSIRRRQRHSPGGRSISKGKPRKPSPAVCALCKERLHGMPRLRPQGLAKLALTQKRPERAFGGSLCASCTRDVLTDRARLQSGVLREDEVPLTRLRYVRMVKH